MLRRGALCSALAVMAAALVLPTPPSLGAEEKRPSRAEQRKKDAAKRAGAPSPAVGKKLLEIQELMSAEKLDQAARILNDLEKRRNLKPADQANVFQFQGYVRIRRDEYKEAAAYFRKAIDLKALSANSQQSMMLQLSRIYGRLERFEEALAAVQEWFATAETPTDEAYYLRGTILKQLGRNAEATADIEKAVSLSKIVREGWYQLLVALYYEADNLPKVAEVLERLVSHYPAKKTYWTTLSQVYAQLERMDRALAMLAIAYNQKILDRDREYLALSQNYINLEIPYQCGQVLDQAIADKVLEGDAKNYGFLANCWLVAREQKRALEPLAKGGEVSEDGNLYLRLAYIHLQRDRYDEAIPVLQKALQKSKPAERGAVHLLIGVAQLGVKQLDEAERALKAAMTDEKARPDAERYLTYLEQERQRLMPPAA